MMPLPDNEVQYQNTRVSRGEERYSGQCVLGFFDYRLHNIHCLFTISMRFRAIYPTP